MSEHGMKVRGIVVRVGARSVQVVVDAGGELRCTLRAVLWESARHETRPVAVGDRVRVKIESATEGVIEAVDERRNRLARQQPAGRFSGPGRTRSGDRAGKDPPVQVIAANLDRILIVASLVDPPFRAGFVDRVLVAAARQGIEPLLVLTKVDLEGTPARPGDKGEPPTRDVARPYRRSGVRVIEASSVSGEGIDELRETLRAGISLAVGHSGVGKTSLLNAVSPGTALSTGSVTSYHGRGRHTTTHVRLVPLLAGGFLVDSPGVREFGLEDVSPQELARLFAGFGDLPDRCRFTDCRHHTEPGCAVRAAVDAGQLLRERHDVYLRLLEEVEGGAV